MSTTREVLTFQFGNYSNYVGSHWWNLQEFSFDFDSQAEPSEIDHNVFYREGLNDTGHVTFTPRLLLVDLNGTLKHIPETGGLYSTNQPSNKSVVDDIKNDIFWDHEKIDVVQTGSQEKSEFQSDLDSAVVSIEDKEYNFNDTVTSWSDFLYTKFHTRTINILKNYTFSAETDAVDTYSNGANLWMSDIFQDDFCDNIRKYIEECNNCQGFQTLFDIKNGFGGLACKSLEYLSDEYCKTIFALPIFSPKSILFENADEKLSHAIELVNIASTYSNLIEHSNLFVPLSTQDRIWKKPFKGRVFKHLNYDSENLYQTSAILATYLETISLKYRFKDNGFTTHLSEFCTELNSCGRKLAAAALSLPFPMRIDHDLIDALNELDSPLFTQLSPNCKIGTDYIKQTVCVRGIPKDRLKRPLHQAQKQMKMAAYKCGSVSEMFQLYFQCSNHASMAHVSATELPVKIQKPYPKDLFDTKLNIEGFATDHERNSNLPLKSIPSIASLQTSEDLADMLESLHREASRVKISKIHRFKETGMESDEYVEILESLIQFKDKYDDKMDL